MLPELDRELSIFILSRYVPNRKSVERLMEVYLWLIICIVGCDFIANADFSWVCLAIAFGVGFPLVVTIWFLCGRVEYYRRDLRLEFCRGQITFALARTGIPSFVLLAWILDSAVPGTNEPFRLMLPVILNLAVIVSYALLASGSGSFFQMFGRDRRPITPRELEELAYLDVLLRDSFARKQYLAAHRDEPEP